MQKKLLNSALKIYPRNLLLNQYKIDLNKNKNILVFNCKKEGTCNCRNFIYYS